MRVMVRAKTDPVRCNCNEEHRLEVCKNETAKPVVRYGYIVEAGEQKMLYYCEKANVVWVR